MEWTELAVICLPESEEAVCEILRTATGCGVSIEAADSAGGSMSIVRTWLASTEATEALLDSVRERLAALPEAGLPPISDFTVSTADDSCWLAAWRAHHRRMDIGRRLCIVPEPPNGLDVGDRQVVFIEPGMAFGTGSHPTTRLTLEYLERLLRPGDRVADVGTGSGILAISAAKLGAAEVWASECDSLPRQIAAENVCRNGVADRVHVLDPDRFETECPPCDLVLCNILAETIAQLSELLVRVAREDGLLVCSGIVAEKLSLVTEALRARRVVPLEIASEGVWRTVLLQRTGGSHR